MPYAIPCKFCGGERLQFKQYSTTIEVWVHCDTCGQTGPAKTNLTDASEAWNEANKPKETN